MKGIILSLRTLQPVLATSFQGDPNSDVSYSYLPGSMIRGAMIGRYMRNHQIDLEDDLVRSLFFDETKTRYLNAYLTNVEGKRTLPVPLSWFKDKNRHLPEPNEGYMKICDRAIEEELPNEDFTPKAVEQKFCRVQGQSVFLYSEKRRINIHNFRNRQKGKGDREEGEIFRYDALDPGQDFQAIILCEDTKLIEKIEKLLKQSPYLWLGGSKSAGYGKTEIKELQFLHDNWCEIDINPKTRINSQTCMITLLSDAILRDKCGHISADCQLVKEKIEETLSEKLPSPKSIRAYSKNTLIGGFNIKWGLPLPQVTALAAGSIILLEDFTLTPEQITKLEYQGIGERRNEGFGRVAVNWLEEAKLQGRKSESKSGEEGTLNESSLKLANLMTERILKQRLEKKLVKKLGERDTIISQPEKDKISNSQLSRLGLAAREGLRQVEVATENKLAGDEFQEFCFKPVRDLLKPENLTKSALDQLNNTRLDSGDCLKNKLKSWLDNPQKWINNSQDINVKLATNLEKNLNDEVGNKLTVEYTLRLIMAVAKNATKEKR